MSSAADYEEWRDKLSGVLEMKVEEFDLLGYGDADKENIWKCIVSRVNRESPKEMVRLHDFVNRLMRMSVNDYMNWLRMDALKAPDLFKGDAPFHLEEFDEPST